METFLMFLGFPMNWGLGAGFGGMNQGFGNSGGRGKSIVNSLKDEHLWDQHQVSIWERCLFIESQIKGVKKGRDQIQVSVL